MDCRNSPVHRDTLGQLIVYSKILPFILSSHHSRVKQGTKSARLETLVPAPAAQTPPCVPPSGEIYSEAAPNASSVPANNPEADRNSSGAVRNSSEARKINFEVRKIYFGARKIYFRVSKINSEAS